MSMCQKKYILVLMMLIVSLSSCVSKKKYLEMESKKLSAEGQVRQLKKENADMQTRIKTMIADYEQIRAELLANNAQKDQLIVNLQGQINQVKNSAAEKNSNMEDKLYAFQYEKRQLQNQIDAKDEEIKAMNARARELATQLGNSQNELNNIKFNYNNTNKELERLQGKLSGADEISSEQQAKINKLNEQISSLKKQSATKDKTIEKLENNVKLLKDQLK